MPNLEILVSHSGKEISLQFWNYNKLRFIWIRFDRWFYLVWAKIRINWISLFLTWRCLSMELLVKIT